MAADSDEIQTAERDPAPEWLEQIPCVPLSENYLISDQCLGTGGFGAVYLATKRRLSQQVAVKRMHAEKQYSVYEQRRLVREVSLLAPLNHPHIVRIEDWGRDHEGLYVVMEYVEGGSLLERVQTRGRLSGSETLQVARQLCCALEWAASQQVVHRDLKPANILQDVSGRIKLADFGLARPQESDDSTGLPAFTFAYAAPEQLNNEPLDQRTDFFSLGATLYHLASGRIPADRHYDLSSVPEVLHEVLRCLLQRQPEHRCQTVEEVVQLLDAAEQASGGEAASVRKAADADLLVDTEIGDRNRSRTGSVETPELIPAGGDKKRSDLGEYMRQVRQKILEVHDRARELIQQHQYSRAVDVLEEIDADFEHLRDEQLYRYAVDRRDRCVELENLIVPAARRLQFSGIRPLVQELLQLQPERTDMQDVLQEIDMQVPPKAPDATRLSASFCGGPFLELSYGDRREFLLQYLNRVAGASADQGIYLAPNIPEHKHKNAFNLAEVPRGEDVLALIDHTVFGSAKNCLVVGKLGLYGRNDWTSKVSGPWVLSWEEFLTAAIRNVSGSEIEMMAANKTVFINRSGATLSKDKEIEFLQQLQTFVRDLGSADAAGVSHSAQPLLEDSGECFEADECIEESEDGLFLDDVDLELDDSQ